MKTRTRNFLAGYADRQQETLGKREPQFDGGDYDAWLDAQDDYNAGTRSAAFDAHK